MRRVNSLMDRVIAMALCVIMVLGMVVSAPHATAAESSSLTTDMGNKTYVTEQVQEFTFTTTAGTDQGKMVVGTFEFSDRDAVKKLEYYEVQTGTWREFYGDFGPQTGFPLTDATSRFRVTFQKAGSYTVKAAMVTVSDRTPLCSVEASITVADNTPSTLSSNLDEGEALVKRNKEFYLSWTAGKDAGTAVLGTIEFADGANVSLEYQDGQSWVPVTSGRFGGDEGFPMADGAAAFRVKFAKSGSYTMTASLGTLQGEVLCSVTKTVVVERNAQTGFGFEQEAPGKRWVGENFQNKAEGGQSSGAITYEIVDGKNVAEVSNEGTLTFRKTGKVTVKAVRAGDKEYLPAEATYTVEAVKNPVENFQFAKQNPQIGYQENLKYPNNDNPNELVNQSGSIHYAIVQDGQLATQTDVAQINAATGELTVLKPGTVTVRAIREEDGSYERAEAEYTLTVNKGKQSFAFEGDKTIRAVYGQNSAQIRILLKQSNGAKAVYAIDKNENDLGVTVDENGKVTFAAGENKVGSVTVRVTLPENEYYEEYTDRCEVVLRYEETPAAAYVLSGKNRTVGDKKWFYADVTITAPDGYSLRRKGAPEGTDWANSIVLTEEECKTFWNDGKFNPPEIVLKNETTQGITGTIQVNDLNWDVEAPNNLTMQYNVRFFQTIAQKIFGFSKEQVLVTVSAADSMSGIAKMEYSLDNGDHYTEIARGNQFTVNAQYRGQLQLRATDAAGNKRVYKDQNDESQDRILVVDDIAPKVTIQFTGGQKAAVKQDGERITRETMAQPDKTTRFVYDGQVTAKISVYEDNFFPEQDNMKIQVFRDGKLLTDPAANGVKINAWEQKQDEKKNTYYEKTLTLTEDGDYQIKVEYADFSKNGMEWNSPGENREKTDSDAVYLSNIHTIDTTAPIYEITYQYAENHDVQSAVIRITDRNFRPSEVDWRVSGKNISGSEMEIDSFDLTSWQAWKQSEEDENTWSAEVSFSQNANYEIYLDYTDLAGHKMVNKDQKEGSYSEKFTVDHLGPNGLKVEYRSLDDKFQNKVLNQITFGHHKAGQEVRLSMQDEFTGIDYILLTVTPDGPQNATDLQMPKDLKVDASGKVLEGDKGFIRSFQSKAGANGQLTLSFDVPAQFRGTVTFTAVDKNGNRTSYGEDPGVLVVDSIAPQVTIQFSGSCMAAVKQDGTEITRETVSQPDGTTRFVYDGAVTAKIVVREANFFPEQDNMKIRIFRDGKLLTDPEATGVQIGAWSRKEDEDKTAYYEKTLTLTEEGDYQIEVEYADFSQNSMEWNSPGENKKDDKVTYTSNIHTIDKTAPVYEISYRNDADGDIQGATIRITDRNFRPNEVLWKVTSTDISGEPVDHSYAKLTSWKDWKQSGEDGSTWTAEVSFAEDANYEISLDYTDLAGHKMADKDQKAGPYQKTFTVDHARPYDLNVEYRSKGGKVVNKILDKITFGNHKAGQEIVLSMADATSGIDYILLTVMPENPKTANTLKMPKKELKISADGKILEQDQGFIQSVRSEIGKNGRVTLSFDVPAQFRGTVTFTAVDKFGNRTVYGGNPGTLVVDTIQPGRTISYHPANVVNGADLKDRGDFVEKDGITDRADGDDAYVMYFAADAVATIQIQEANFDGADTRIRVVNAAGENVKNWKASDWTTDTEADDVHTMTVTIPEEGDYRILVSCVDASGNEMASYRSQRIVVDKTAPVVSVRYGNTDVKNVVDGRSYFAAAQTATITVRDHNFRADDVEIQVTAKDVQGRSVLTLNPDGTLVKAYEEQGKTRTNWSAYDQGTWRRSDDTYIITLNYAADANYTFDIRYHDLAGNQAADYQQDLFTVDTAAPTNLKITYSESLFQEILEKVTFGYYNAKVRVAIQAEDATGGIYHFAYSYVNSSGVSSVNAELLDQAIRQAEIRYENGMATAAFEIPKEALGGGNQFNGTVMFTAYDRSENHTEKRDNTRIVVDSISPSATVSYNDPVKTVDGTAYYSGNINGSIVIDEANFDASDVVVSATKDGKDYPVNVAWGSNSVDIHTGSFTLTEDGDYIISVRYRDKSGNRMNDYVSNQMTVDKTAPVIRVSGIKANSANKAQKYGFTITVEDTNLDTAAVKPVLKMVKRNGKGTYEVVEVDLGKAVIAKDGKSCAYTVENLPDDGLYTLTCEAKDTAANVISKLVLDDGKAYDQAQFSVNRHGSTFAYGDDFTEKLVGQYYIYSVDADVVIVETNVDPIDQYKVTLNGRELAEGTDYTTQQTSNEGQWSKRTYVIHKDLFANEGEYAIIVSSVDKTETAAYSDVKNLTMAFVVDQTKPVLTITGLETGGRYQTEEQTVTLIPTDEGGRLNRLTVSVLDATGNPIKDANGTDISIRFDMSGEELLKYLEEHDGKVTFTIPEGLNNQVRIVCSDCAVNAENQTNEYDELFRRVTVSKSQFVIFYANRPVFFGTLAGIAVAIVLILLLIRRKKGQKIKEKV